MIRGGGIKTGVKPDALWDTVGEFIPNRVPLNG